MQQISLAYGRNSVKLDFDGSRFEVPTAADSNRSPLSDAEIGAAFDSPIESPSLEEILNPGESVLIVVSDATRATASAQVVNLLVRRVIQNGISPADIAIIFATGIHRQVASGEKQHLLTPFIIQRIRVLDHDANDAKALLTLTTSSTGPIEVNRALKDFSHVILTGGISFHYFAGFTGGRKSICPGLASAQTVRATHMLALDFENGGRRAGVGTGLLEGNAVHEACDGVAALVKPCFSVNTVVDDRGRPTDIYAGHWRAAHLTGCVHYKANHSFRIGSKRKLVIASCGGWPYDINLIQAHKALDMAANACADGGTIVLLAECSDGIGRADFLRWFEETSSERLAARLREAYEVNGQTAWALLMKSERYRIILISDLPDAEVTRMGMTPVGSIDDALAQLDANIEGYILPRGAALLPIVTG